MKTEFTLLLPFLIAMAFALAGCTGDHNDRAAAEPARMPERSHRVTLTSASVREIGLTLSLAETLLIMGKRSVPSKLLPNQDFEAQVGSLVQGRVQTVLANVGDFVREGQELMRIEGLEVGEIKSDFIKARAHMKYAEANYQRQKALLEKNVGSQKSFLDVKADYERALAEFEAEDKRIHSIGLTDDDLLEYVEYATPDKVNHIGGVLPIKTPIAGTVVERNVVIGQHVDASTTAFRIVNTSILWADGQVYEKDAREFEGKPDVTLTVTAFPGEEFRGRVIYVSPVVDEKTRTITIRASIPNRSGRLKPQMYGELHIPVATTVRGLVIPAESVQKDNGESYVFVALTDTSFERRQVSLGTSFDSMVEVNHGLSPGERVVQKGSFQLKSELMKEALEGGE